MELEVLEALALSTDRAAALAQLLPGSEDHDYFLCLHAQHAGKLDDAEKILDEWTSRHGHDDRYDRLLFRQQLYRLDQDPASVADDIRDRFGVSHSHEAEADEVDATRPSVLEGKQWNPKALLDEAVGASSNLSYVTDEALYELVGAKLDDARRRSLLQRIHHTPDPALVRAIAADFAAYRDTRFGALGIHDELTREQLEELAKLISDLRGDGRWVDAMVRRMRPPYTVDLTERDAREQYLVELWAFVKALPGAMNTLKAHVLWHLLDTLRRRDAVDRDLFITYLQLPRNASYVAEKWLSGFRDNERANLGADLSATTGLPPAADDEELVRDLVHRMREHAAKFREWLEREWLEAEIATAQLLAGTADAEKATRTLGPARAAELRERIDLEWCLHNPARFGVDEPVVLEADIKNVPDLLIKVFRIDPLAYFQNHRRDVDTDLDLDGLAASHEITMKLAEPPVRLVRRRIELPMCSRAGTYVIDLIGNGKASRALVHKGRLRHVARTGADGRVVTVLDEAGRPKPGARAWIAEREYIADDKATFVIPFSTRPGTTPMLLSAGDIATVTSVELVREVFELAVDLWLDRQALTAGRTAQAITRARLLVAGAPASVSLLTDTTWDITLTDRHGVATTKSQPLALSDDDATMLELPIGEDTSSITIAIRGTVKVVSEQREQKLEHVTAASFGQMHATDAIDALYLARTAKGWVVSALGKSGEPRAQRPITVSLRHRWSTLPSTFELATDAAGRVELGELPGCVEITATFGSASQTWNVSDDVVARAPQQVPAERSAYVTLPPGRSAADAIQRASLVELRGDVFVRHPEVELVALESAIEIRSLPPGEYVLRAPGIANVALLVAAPGAEIAGHVVTSSEVLEVSRVAPAIAKLTAGKSLAIALVGATRRTRVHVIATRLFRAPLVEEPRRPVRPRWRFDRAPAASFVSGRELGDEYRYVLDRRTAKRYPSLQLDKPGLLLNPWARRTTSTDVAKPKPGGAFRAAAPPASQAMAGYGGARAGASVDQDAYVTYDFLAEPPVVLANVAPKPDGSLDIPMAQLDRATTVTIIVDDPGGVTRRRVHLPEQPLAPRDLRLILALDPARHSTQKKAIAPLRPSESLVIEDLATAEIHLLDSVARAHSYLLALRDDATLREFAFVTRWHELPDSERRELYSKYACHELHLFLYFKDRTFFDAVVRPYLAHKRTKTFVDHWLLDADLARYLDPAERDRLNAFERALLAWRLTGDDALPRLLADAVATQPPAPERDTQLIDTLIGASALEATGALEQARKGAKSEASAKESKKMAAKTRAFAADGPMGGDAFAAFPAAAPMGITATLEAEMQEESNADFDDGIMDRRREAAPMYRAVDKTQEWAENNWWHRTPAECDADMIEPNRLWRDVARHRGPGFLSPWLGLASGSFAEAMCALAVTDLPFVAGSHAIVAAGPRLTVTAAANVLAGSSQLVDGELVAGGAPLVVGQSYVRDDDRHEYVDGEQVDKYVQGAFATGVVYTCQVVLANPTSSRQRIAALLQIPRGSIPVSGARRTRTIDVALDPYGTHGEEYSFYFPSPGQFTHFPVHVTRNGEIVAAAPVKTIEVTTGGEALDPTSWPYISQRGKLEEVVAFLERANLAAIELEAVAWRMKKKPAYTAILETLEKRRVFEPELWGYALLHRDKPRIRTWLRARGDELTEAGPVLDTLGIDAEWLGEYEHLELAPLINARAHQLGGKLRILNDGLDAQYRRFLDLVAHRRAPTSEDLLAAAAYLLAQDRQDATLAMLRRVDPAAVAERLQHDYLAAYAACLAGELPRARELVQRWRDLPVDRWRRKLEAVGAMLDEVAGGAGVIVDPQNREQQQADLAARQPTFEIAVDREGVVIHQQHCSAIELRFFEMDVELLFSRQPFVQSDVSRFSFIEPGHREVVTAPGSEQRVAWPAQLRGKNVVVEAVAAGTRKGKIHYANDLATNLSQQYGQVRVQRASDRSAMPATYVKVYARKRGGSVDFYKDGYTDLRGWFDYATLSTNDLDEVDRFAILVCSDHAGAAIFEASPPAR
jgi:hypothetical protein